MAKSSAIFSNPKSKPLPAKGSARQQPKTASGHYAKRDSKSGLMVLPPGPPNTIVRTPYPFAPKDGEFSE